MSDRRRGLPELGSYVRAYYNHSGGIAAEGCVYAHITQPAYEVRQPDGSSRTVMAELEWEPIPDIPDEVLQAANLAAFPGLPEGMHPQEARNRSDAAARMAWAAAMSMAREADRG